MKFKKKKMELKKAEEIPIATVTLRGVQAATFEFELVGHYPQTITLLPGDMFAILVPRDSLTDKAFEFNG